LYWLHLLFCTRFSGWRLFGCSGVQRTSAAEALSFSYLAVRHD
jgi:hypothetical protein